MQENNISPNNFENCLKCNICTEVCPMMAANPHYPGPKQAGPDGERYRLKDPAFYDLTLKYCLNCKRCEVACPSGVKVGDIIQIARLKHGRQTRPIRDTALASTDFVGTLASAFAPVANPLLKSAPVKGVLDVLGVDHRRTFPAYSSQKFVDWFRNEAPSQEGFRRYVSYFHGCYANYNYPALGRAFVTLLNACGYGVRLLDKEKCCGVALISNGMSAQATRQAKVNLASIRKALKDGSEAVLTSSSTCTFTMRDEYSHILGLAADDVRGKLTLAVKFLFDKVETGAVRLAFKPEWHASFAYHTACHMQKLGWQLCSTGLLRKIPGLKLAVLPQECCGIAGTFGFKKENYPYSQKIGEKLFRAIRGSGASAVVTDCETCKWQIEMGTGYAVHNPLEVLLSALDIEKTTQLNK